MLDLLFACVWIAVCLCIRLIFVFVWVVRWSVVCLLDWSSVRVGSSLARCPCVRSLRLFVCYRLVGSCVAWCVVLVKSFVCR